MSHNNISHAWIPFTPSSTPYNTDASSHPVTTSHCSSFVLSFQCYMATTCIFHELVPIQNGSRYHDNTTIKTNGYIVLPDGDFTVYL
ncbi:hypothetical protein BDR06DRAFT_952359 [Suillus hirtellus]|nr:hypothetical protein BDR06DRAFT_952359 [Suillus hirtellus]